MVALHGSQFDRNLNGKDKIVGRHWCPVLLVVHLSLAASSLHSQWRCHVPSGVRQSRSINTFCPAPNSSPLLKVACANDLPAFLHECDLAGSWTCWAWTHCPYHYCCWRSCISGCCCPYLEQCHSMSPQHPLCQSSEFAWRPISSLCHFPHYCKVPPQWHMNTNHSFITLHYTDTPHT